MSSGIKLLEITWLEKDRTFFFFSGRWLVVLESLSWIGGPWDEGEDRLSFPYYVLEIREFNVLIKDSST